MSTDESQIRALIMGAALIADEGTIEDYASVFTVDAVWSNKVGEQRGLEEIQNATRERRAAGATGPGAATRHLVTPMAVEVNGDSAEATTYFLLLGNTSEAPQIRMFGRYHDVVVRTTEGWRIASRSICGD